MTHIIVGSKNPVKLETVTRAFLLVFPEGEHTFVPHSAPSGVPDQPWGNDETRLGAKNRADACATEYPHADYFVGLEGGLERLGDDTWAFAWMCVRDTRGRYGYGRTGSFVLPPVLAALIEAGKELGHASDEFFRMHNTKQQGGSVGILSNGLISRADFYHDAVIFALMPFMQATLYKS